MRTYLCVLCRQRFVFSASLINLPFLRGLPRREYFSFFLFIFCVVCVCLVLSVCMSLTVFIMFSELLFLLLLREIIFRRCFGLSNFFLLNFRKHFFVFIPVSRMPFFNLFSALKNYAFPHLEIESGRPGPVLKQNFVIN